MFEASNTCLLLDARTPGLEQRIGYAIYGHFLRFVQRGARRLEVAVEGPAGPPRSPGGPAGRVPGDVQDGGRGASGDDDSAGASGKAPPTTCVAFERPDGRKLLIVVHGSSSVQTLRSVESPVHAPGAGTRSAPGGASVMTTLPARSVATYLLPTER